MKNPLKKIKFDRKDLEFVKKPLISVIFNGLLINFVLYQIFHLPFTYFSWIAYGILYTYIQNDVIKLIKSAVYKR